MTAFDPYRTLEIAPGAAQPEIRRAYRRLAKLYHPDSAGERALPRFLAIQAAYEALVDEPGRPRTSIRGSTTRPTPAPPPAPAWQADASRARATREAYRARTRRGSGAGPSASGASSAGTTGEPSAGTKPPPNADRGGPAGAGPGSPETGPGSGGRSKRSSRRTKATPGSTSYDGADREPFDPAWEGATWYGAGSGTYWTINPKEYADPRKHGPEYLARSQRATSSTDAPAFDPPPATAAPVDDPPARPEPPLNGTSRPSWDDADTGAAEGPHRAEPSSGDAPGRSSGADPGRVVGSLLGWIRRVR